MGPAIDPWSSFFNFSIMKKQQRQHSAEEHFYQINNKGQHQYDFKDITYTLKKNHPERNTL